MSLTKALSFVAAALAISTGAQAALQHQLLATDNLYYTNWGHWFTTESDGALGIYSPASTSARVVSSGGGAFNFSGVLDLHITTAGSVVDAGGYATGADGCASVADPCWFKDGNYFYKPVYSVIGLWSSTSDTITPIRTENVHGDWRDAVFLVGSDSWLTVPDVANAFLFLAENDGYFADNSGYYSSTLTYRGSEVPLPGALILFGSALATLGVRMRRH